MIRLQTVLGSSAAGVGDITRFFQYSTAATGCGCSAAETQILSADGTLTMTEIDETDRVKRRTRTVDVNGLETTYEYANGGRVTTVTLPGGGTRITENYLDGRVKSVSGTGVVPEYYTYGVNADGSTWTRVDTATATSPRHRTTTFDMAGRLLREESPAFDGSTYTTEYAYDAYGRLAAQSQPGQADTLYVYDSTGDLVRSGLDLDDDGQLTLASADRITDSERTYALENGAWLDQSTTTVYPAVNDATPVTVSTNRRRLSGFTGNLAAETETIDLHGQSTVRTTEIDRANKTVTRTTDVPVSTIDAVSTTINGYLISQNSTTVAAATTYGYDGLGRRTSIQDPRHTAPSTLDYYTGTTQVFTQTDADGNTTAFEYYDNSETGAGQVETVTDALLQKSHYAYDLLGRQTQTWGETDYPQEYGYTAYGELATLTTWRDATDSIDFTTDTWPNPTLGTGDTTTWTYQASTGLLTRKEYADGNGTDYSYDSANRLHVRTWARDGGLDTTYGYDPTTGELTSVDYEDPNTTDIAYTYDRLGRQATVADATGTRSFDYDPGTLQLDTETLDATFYDGMALDRSYDPLGRASGYTLGAPTSLSASYGYDSTGRLKTVSDATPTAGGPAAAGFTYAYEPDSNLLATLEGPVHAVAYAYEPNRDVMTEIDNRATDLQGATLSQYGYTHDALGRRSDRTQSGSAINTPSTDDFAYNPRSEVTGSTNSVETTDAWNPAYAYDKIGNRLWSVGVSPNTYTTNELNQYTQVSSLSSQPSHDADGNLTSDGGTWTYIWNNENRLSSATDGTTTIDFTYDYQGRLVKKDDGTDVEVYLYDGWNRIATFTPQASSLSLQSSYLWGLDLSGSMQGAGGVGGLLSESEISNGQISDQRYALYDANGNIMQKLDGTGAVVMSVDYDPFGNIIDGTLVGEYGFSTKPLIDDLDWYYYGFRYYDPVTGRWPSRDPIEERGGVNLYAFVGNDAANYFDLLGAIKKCCGGSEYDPSQRRCCGDESSGVIYNEYTIPRSCCADKSNATLGKWGSHYQHLGMSLDECIEFYKTNGKKDPRRENPHDVPTPEDPTRKPRKKKGPGGNPLMWLDDWLLSNAEKMVCEKVSCIANEFSALAK